MQQPSNDAWTIVLANLKDKSDAYLRFFRLSCVDQLDHSDDGRVIEMAKFMLDAIDHTLNERGQANG